MESEIASESDILSPPDGAPQGIDNSNQHLPVASRRHLLAFLVLSAVVAAWGAFRLPQVVRMYNSSDFSFRLRCGYATIFVFEFAQVLFVVIGTRKTRTSVADLIGGRWHSARDVARDLLLGIALWLLWTIVAICLVAAFHPKREGMPNYFVILPRTPTDVTLWVIISLAAGFCEEFAFRGYLQRQFLALTQSRFYAVVGQGLVFGLIHIYQGWFNVFAISLLGILFGWFAARRKSLRPGMIAHAWQDATIGVLFFIANRYR